jgi:hypothetical protein
MTQEIKAKLITPKILSLVEADRYLIDLLNSRYSALQNSPKKLQNNTKKKISTKKSP